MRAFVGIGGCLFAAVFVVHLLRVWAEGPALLKEPVFIITSAVSLAAAIWAAVLLLKGRRAGRPGGHGVG